MKAIFVLKGWWRIPETGSVFTMLKQSDTQPA
ncbi:trp operon leader peptide [Shigella flexneri]